MIGKKFGIGAPARRKFFRYRLWFAISLAACLLAWILEMALAGAGIRVPSPGGGPFLRAFAPLATWEGILYLFTLLTGVTVYAPAAAILTAALRGFSAGFILSSLLPLSGGKALFAFCLTTLYLALSALWFIAYGAFCACVALRIFSSHTEKCAAGEERLFGGSLFFTEYFCGAVNLRFLCSYILFFFASLGGQLLLAACFVWARVHL
ncbi:MAG: hypothetical protein J6Z79_04485 [Clostridia bacterium]|nr:hypothetical protein [Clostridia bacterium]